MSKKATVQLNEEILARYLAETPESPKPHRRPTKREAAERSVVRQWDLENLHRVLFEGGTKMDLDWYVNRLSSMLAEDYDKVSAPVKLEILRELKKLNVLAAVQVPDVDAYVKKREEGVSERKKGQGVDPFNLKAAS